MKNRDNAERLIDYLRKHPQPTTVAALAAAGVMNSRDASDAVQYGVRHGVIERIRRPGARPNERAQYQLTGRPSPVAPKGIAGPSFDALLTAWGIARVPPRLLEHAPARVVMLE
ncbi:hypothetical protein R75465_08019 [Paraburkholderia aspalathi]|uniref:hypothetical protein n=1 Tax=Paraburkholderia aspalathi TaxID=1324617 RepID=UPI001B1BF5AE|nr:hypothetical protein [Paraburkholderia aspalathi]CAE6866899.1 hypothetical protein R75465_08019 [Paraburkholderia aspalathi]